MDCCIMIWVCPCSLRCIHMQPATSMCSVWPCCFILLLQDSRSSSPARSPKGLQTVNSEPAAVQGTDSDHAPTTAATHEQKQQQELLAALTPTTPANGTSGAAGTPAVVSPGTSRPASVTWQDLHQQNHQQQLESELAATNGTGDSTSSPVATNGVSGSRPVPPVPPLAPGTAPVRTSSSAASACNSRRQSLLSDACRASSSLSFSQVQQQQDFPAQLGQQQQPGRTAVAQLPLHLLRESMDSPSPPSVAFQVSCTPVCATMRLLLAHPAPVHVKPCCTVAAARLTESGVCGNNYVYKAASWLHHRAHTAVS